MPQALNPTNLLFLVLFFVLAFFLYSAIYGALGVGAEDEQHLTQLAWPVITPIAMNPNAPFAASILLAIAILLGSIAGAVFAAARIFRVGILMTGKRFAFGEIVRRVGR